MGPASSHETQASSVCFGVDGALIALYGVFLGAGFGNTALLCLG